MPYERRTGGYYDSAESEEEGMTLRSRDIKRRRSIHDNSPDPNRLDPQRLPRDSSVSPEREFSKSPSKLYPNLPASDDSYVTDSRKTPFNESHETVNKANYTWHIAAVTAILFLACIFLLKGTSNKTEGSSLVNCTEFLELKGKFPRLNPKMFKALQVATEGLYNRDGRISVVAFFSTNQNILQDLTKDIVETTRRCIGQSHDPISITYKDLNKEKFLKDNSKIIGEYKEELKKRTIMIINNLESIPPIVLPAFHSFADTYNPLVKKSIIYLTFKIPEEPKEEPIVYINTHLNKIWHEMGNNIRGPLITRLLDQMFYLDPIY